LTRSSADLPRVIALVCALAILSSSGQWALSRRRSVAWFYGGMGPAISLRGCMTRYRSRIFEVGINQAALWRWSRHRRLQRRLAGERQCGILGNQTTTSVVKSIFLVIVSDGLFAIFFASIGM